MMLAETTSTTDAITIIIKAVGGGWGVCRGERETNERENNYEREGEKRDMKEKITDNRRGNKIKTERRKPYFGIYSLKVSGHFMK